MQQEWTRNSTQKKNQALWMKGHDLAVKMGGPRSGGSTLR